MNLVRYLLSAGAVRLTPAHRSTHTLVIGQPGIGKSRALEAWAMQDIAQGHGVAVIDVHGDLFRHLETYISSVPELVERVVILDPTDRRWVVSFNPLEAISGLSQERVALFLTDVVVKIWKLDVANAPRLVWLLTNTFLALANLRLSLLDLPRFLLDAEFREGLLPRLKNETARNYFTFEFPRSQAAVHQWVAPALNKLSGLIFDPDVRLMLTGRSTINFRQVLDRKLVLLVHLPKGIIGEGTSALLGAFIVAHFQKAALSRANAAEREPYYLYLDEFQNYTTDNIKDILSESRKYGLSLTLAHQYLDQLSPDLRSAVLSTAGTIVCFRVGYHDAYLLAKEVFPSPAFLGSSTLRLRRFLRWPLVTLAEHHQSLGWDGLAHQLANLPLREFWMRRRGPHAPELMRTLKLPEPVMTPELLEQIQHLRDLSGARYGRRKQAVAREFAGRPNIPTRTVTDNGRKARSENRVSASEIPLWGD